MNRPNPFSLRLEGPRTDTERAVFRVARERDNHPQPTPEGFEHITTTKDVRAYLQERFPNDPTKSNLCQYPIGCDITDVEPFLIDDLIAEKMRATESKGSNETIARLRKLIRAASWISHARPRDEPLLALARSLADEVEKKQQEIARTDPQESKEWNDVLSMAHVIASALHDHLAGAEAESAAQAIEYFVDIARKNPHDQRRLKHLRELRDQLYFQRLYPTWFLAGMKEKT